MNRDSFARKNCFEKHLPKANDLNRLESISNCAEQASSADSLQPAPFRLPPPLLVFSHLRWHFVTQRPQHLLTHAAESRTVYFWEEPCVHPSGDESYLTP